MWELAFPIAPCLAVLAWCFRGTRCGIPFARPPRSNPDPVSIEGDIALRSGVSRERRQPTA